jgi:prepilin-type processing-associated H-X9-DG protein
MFFSVNGGNAFSGDPMSDNANYSAKMPQSKIVDVLDGTSNTVFFSEGLASRQNQPDTWGGTMGEQTHGDIGGSLFSLYDPPNSLNYDWVCRPCPHNQGDALYVAGPKTINPYTGESVTDYCNYNANCGNAGVGHPDAWWHEKAAARSHHTGGVNAGMVDGSVRFISNNINFVTWRQLGTRAGNESLTDANF